MVGMMQTKRRVQAVVRVSLVGAVVAVGLAASWSAHGESGERRVVVREGDSLYRIAVREFPDESPSEAVARVRVANDLPGSDLPAGMVLRIPSK